MYDLRFGCIYEQKHPVFCRKKHDQENQDRICDTDQNGCL